MLMNAYANAGKVKEAQKWQHELLTHVDKLQAYDYTPLLKGCARSRNKGGKQLAADIFREQVGNGVEPDHFNLRTLKSAVGEEAFKELCAELHVNPERARLHFEGTCQELSVNSNFLKQKAWKIENSHGSSAELKRNSFV